MTVSTRALPTPLAHGESETGLDGSDPLPLRHRRARSTTASRRSSGACCTTRRRSSPTSSSRSPAPPPSAASRTATSTSRCSPMASAPSASRASRSTSPTATSPPAAAASSSPTAPVTCSTRATWSPARRPPTPSIVLIDGRKGVLEQTRRHLAVVALLRVPHVIVAVNKIDLLGFAEDAFAEVADAGRGRHRRARHRRRARAPRLGARGRQHRRPLAPARPGTTVRRCSNCSSRFLRRTSSSTRPRRRSAFRCSSCCARRADSSPSSRPMRRGRALRDYRAVAGRISSGAVRVGDRVAGLPHRHQRRRSPASRSAGCRGRRGRRAAVRVAAARRRRRRRARRASSSPPARCRRVDAMSTPSCSSSTPGRSIRGARVLVKHGTATVQAIDRPDRVALRPRLARPRAGRHPAANDIGRARLRLAADLPLEPYSANRHGRLVPRHPSVRRRNSGRRHRARLTTPRTHPPPPNCPLKEATP